MAEATQEKQIEQSELLKELKPSLTAIVQQLQIAGAADSTVKDEFQKANMQVLQAILEGNKLKETAEAGLGDEEGKDESRWGKLLGHFGWAKKFQERSAKMAKVAAGSVVKFGKTKLAKVAKFAGNMLDLLLKGLGLGILWALFKWLEDKDWDTIVSEVKKFVEAIGLDWDATVATLKSIQTTLTEWGGLMGGIWTTIKTWKTIAWIAAFAASPLALLWAALKGIFAIGGSIGKLFIIVGGWTAGIIFGEGGALRKLWGLIKGIFGIGGTIAGLAGKVLVWALPSVFGELSPLMKLWKNIKGFFGIGGKLSQTPGFLMTAEQMVDAKGLGLNKEGPLVRLWKWIKSFFGAESKLAGAWKAIKESKAITTLFGEGSHFRNLINWTKSFFGTEGKIASMYRAFKESKTITTLFGEGSHLRNLVTWIGSFFGPESNLGKAATWIGSKVKLFKDYLMIGEAGKGGAISRLFSWVGSIFGGIGDGWKAVKNSKFFSVIKSVLGFGVKIGGGILKVLSKIFYPLTFILGIATAIWGFVQGFMGKEGVKDERTFATKITDGLKGAMKGLLDFFVIDLVVMVQDVLNYFVDMWNNSMFGKIKQFGKFSFGDDLNAAVTKSFGFSEQSSLAGDGGPVDIDKVLATAGGRASGGVKGTKKKYEIGIDKFGDAIEKLDMVGLQKMAEKMDAMDKNKNIELKNAEGITKRLQAEMKERLAEVAANKNKIPSIEKAVAESFPGTPQSTNVIADNRKGSTNFIAPPQAYDGKMTKYVGYT